MHRIDGANATSGNLFTEGDPTSGAPATVVTDDWLNAVQEELCAVVAATGVALSKPTNNQVLTAIKALIDLANPVGSVQWGYFATAPTGFLFMDGQLVPRSVYPRLWAHVQAAGLAVSEGAWAGGQFGMFSVGDGASSFRLPRAGGQFPRVLDRGAGVDAGRTLGSLQADQNQAHTHGGVPLAGADVDRANPGGASAFSIDETGSTASSGGTEARPKSIAWAACVRF